MSLNQLRWDKGYVKEKLKRFLDSNVIVPDKEELDLRLEKLEDILKEFIQAH